MSDEGARTASKKGNSKIQPVKGVVLVETFTLQVLWMMQMHLQSSQHIMQHGSYVCFAVNQLNQNSSFLINTKLQPHEFNFYCNAAKSVAYTNYNIAGFHHHFLWSQRTWWQSSFKFNYTHKTVIVINFIIFGMILEMPSPETSSALGTHMRS